MFCLPTASTQSTHPFPSTTLLRSCPLYVPDKYDEVDECARCSNCGRAYQVAAEHRPPQPHIPQYDPLSAAAQSDSLAQFRDEAGRVSKAMMRQTAGGSYQMYERWFTEALGPAIDKLDPVLRPQAITRSEEHTSELQSLMRISYAVFCLEKQKKKLQTAHLIN